MEQNLDKIKSIAILPLVVGDETGSIATGPGNPESEIAAFVAYWKENFNSEFKKNIKLIDGIEVKYPGEDFIKAVSSNADYGQLMDDLEVDAVLGFNLVGYNETQLASSVLFFAFGAQEKAMTYIDLHFYYLHIEKWSPYLRYYDTQREGALACVLYWLDKHWPLSANFEKPPEKKEKDKKK
jgi:hypothetical protein